MTWATQPTVSSEPASASRWCRGWTRQFAGFAARRSAPLFPNPRSCSPASDLASEVERLRNRAHRINHLCRDHLRLPKASLGAARVWPRLRISSNPSSTPWTSTLSIRARRWRRWPSVRASWVTHDATVWLSMPNGNKASIYATRPEGVAPGRPAVPSGQSDLQRAATPPSSASEGGGSGGH